MSKLSYKKLVARDKKRNISAELLEAATQVKNGKFAKIHRFDVSDVVKVRTEVGLSQAKFAALIGVSVRTLQGWEQGQRAPSGAARTLLNIAIKHPDIIREYVAG
jgi:putative transcriptional regulator